MTEQKITLQILFEMEKQDFTEIGIKSYGDRHLLDKLIKQHKNEKHAEEEGNKNEAEEDDKKNNRKNVKILNKRHSEEQGNKKEAEKNVNPKNGLKVCLDTLSLKNPQHKCRLCGKALSQICSCNIQDPKSDNPQHRVHENPKHCQSTHSYTCDKCGKIANSKKALDCHMYAIHQQNSLKQCETCKERFVTEDNLKKHIDKYHTVKNMNMEEIVILPEVTERRKNNLHEIVIEDGSIDNVEELLQESEEEYDPKDGGNTSDSDEADVEQVAHREERSK